MLPAALLAIQVAEGQLIETRESLAASRVDWEQNGPCQDAAEEGDRCADAKITKEKIGVEGLVLQSIGVGDLPEGAEPIEETGWESGRPLSVSRQRQYSGGAGGSRRGDILFAQRPEVRPRSVVAAVRPAQDQEDDEIYGSNNQSRNECCDET